MDSWDLPTYTLELALVDEVSKSGYMRVVAKTLLLSIARRTNSRVQYSL